jgi:L-asparaginase/Glu-tRNA(Gln) amidotransferase subunit D
VPRGRGAIFGDHMTGQQARIELMLAIGLHGGDVQAVREVVEAGRYEH